MEYFNNSMVYDRKKVKEALKVVEYGHHNKFKYTQAKDLICYLAQIFVSHGLVKVSKKEDSDACLSAYSEGL